MSQARKHSLTEQLLSTAIGFVVSFTFTPLIMQLIGVETTFNQNIGVVLLYTLLSVLRGYGVRRLFNTLHTRGIL